MKNYTFDNILGSKKKLKLSTIYSIQGLSKKRNPHQSNYVCIIKYTSLISVKLFCSFTIFRQAGNVKSIRWAIFSSSLIRVNHSACRNFLCICIELSSPWRTGGSQFKSPFFNFFAIFVYPGDWVLLFFLCTTSGL